MTKTIKMTQEEYDRFQQNIKAFGRYQDEEKNVMAHEAGHMLLLRKFFPNNTYTYGVNEKGNPCVNNPYKDYDFEKPTVSKQLLMVSLAGLVAYCKYIGISNRETQLIMDYLVDGKNRDDDGDLWKYQGFSQLCAEFFGVKWKIRKLVSDTYDALDIDAIQAEVEYQKSMKKVA